MASTNRLGGKNLAILVLAAALTSVCASNQVVAAELPAVKAPQGTLVSPSAADTYYGASTAHTASGPDQRTSAEIAAISRALGANRLADQEFTENALDYVRANIDVEFRYGLGKGAVGALIDQSGTPFDQAQLLTEMLRFGGVTVSYSPGTITLDAQTFGRWTGMAMLLDESAQTVQVDAAAACRFLADGGIPAVINGSSREACDYTGVVSSIELRHLWVVANGTLLDPSFKPYYLRNGSDITALAGCGINCAQSIIAAGAVGSSTGVEFEALYVENLNGLGIVAALDSLAIATQGSLAPDSEITQIDDIAGLKSLESIIPSDWQGIYQASGSWAGDIPDQYRTSLTLNWNGFVGTYYYDDISGGWIVLNKFGVYFEELDRDLSGRGKLHYLGTGDPLHEAALFFLKSSAIIDVDHPYASPAVTGSTTGIYADASEQFSFVIPGQVMLSAGNVGIGRQKHEARLANVIAMQSENVYQDWAIAGAVGSMPLPAAGECTALFRHCTAGSYFADWAAQTARIRKIIGGIAKVNAQHHHSVGIVSVVGGVVIEGAYSPADVVGSHDFNSLGPLSRRVLADIRSGLSYSSRDGNPELQKSAAIVNASLMDALEGGILDQQQRTWFGGSSVSSLFPLANENSIRVYLADPSNSATLLPNLTGLTLTQMAHTSDFLAQTGRRALVAKNVVGSVWDDYGSDARPVDSTPLLLLSDDGSVISYLNEVGAKGAGAAGAAPPDPLKAALAGTNPTDKSVVPLASQVSLSTGALIINSGLGFATGSQGEPAGLDLRYFYNSVTPTSYSRVGSESSYAFGWVRSDEASWSHSLELRAFVGSDAFQGLGEDSAIEASAALAGFAVLLDLAADLSTPEQLLTLILSSSWLSDQLELNSVSIRRPPNDHQFVRLPDGSYNPPQGSYEVLEEISGIGRKNLWLGQYNPDDSPNAFPNAAIIKHFAYKLYMDDGSVATIGHHGQSGEPVGRAPYFAASSVLLPTGISTTYEYYTFRYDCSSTGAILTDTETRLSKVKTSTGREFSFRGSADPACSTDSSYIKSILGRAYTPENGKSIGWSSEYGGDGRSLTHPVDQDTLIWLDGAGNQTRLERDLLRNVRKIYLPGSSISPYLTIEYDALGHVSRLTDAEGVTTDYYVAAIGGEKVVRGESVNGLSDQTIGFFDEKGREILALDPLGRRTASAYDFAGRKTESTLPEGNKETFAYDARHNLTRKTRHPKPGNLSSNIVESYGFPATCSLLTMATCNKPTWLQDPSNYRVSLEYYDNGLIKKITAPTVGGSAPISSYTYNSLGQLSSITDPENRITNFDYYPVDSTTSSLHTNGELMSRTVDPLGFSITTSLAYDDIGSLIKVTDPLNNETLYSWDGARRLIQIDAPEYHTKQFVYNTNGLMTERKEGGRTETPVDVEVCTEENNPDFDPLAGDGSSPYITVCQVETQIQVTYDLISTLLEYDAAGRHVATTTPDLAATRNTYDIAGRLAQVTDPVGRITKNVYDAAGQITTVIRAFGTPLQQDYVTYTYSENGQQASVTDANGNRTDRFYDGFDRLAQTRFPVPATGAGASNSADFEAFTYDANSNVLTKRTRKGDVVKSAYDALDRLVRQVLQMGDADISALLTSACGVLSGEICYEYDLTGEQTRAAHADNSYIIIHSYDTTGRLTATNDNGRPLTFGYDAAGNRTEVHWPDASNTPVGQEDFYIKYYYDALNRVTAVTERGLDPSIGYVAAYGYDALSRRTSLSYANGRTTEYTYEADSALDEMNHWSGDIGISTKTVGYGFDYNLTNQMSYRSISDNTFMYLTASDKSEGYAPNGLNQYTSISRGSVSYALSYDGNGSLTGDGAWDYVYDVENRLTSANGPGVAATYDYDPLGRRSKKSGSGVATEVYLNDGVEEIADADASGNVLRRYIHGPGIDEYLMMISYDAASGTETGREFYHADYLGSIIATSEGDVGAGNAIADIYTYSSYGETGAEGPTGNPFRYTGRRLDAETGLYYYRARYYAPALGRFLQTDPIGYGDNMNMYGYVANDPVNGKDPSGEEISTSSTVETRADGTTKATVYIKFTGAIQNSGGTLPAGTTLADQASALETQIEADYSQTYTDAAGNVTEYRTEADIIVGQATASNKRHNVEITSTNDPRLGVAGSGSIILGRAPGFENGNDLLINIGAFNFPGEFLRTGSHEFGHLAGLRHPNDPANSIIGLSTINLMSQSVLSNSHLVIRSQLRAIFKTPKFR